MARKSRSGTKWTEADYTAAGYVQRKLRLKKPVADRLEAIAKALAISQSEAIEVLCNSWSERATNSTPKKII
jgi:hypothetical protein